jgi:adenosylcobinamide kinase/adenosylcobinamide-phosphate guanylyltransferase
MAIPQSHLILGGARSGKSGYAVALARALGGTVAVLATASSQDASMRARIARHRAERPSGWITVEEPLDVAPACRRAAGRAEVVLLDCLTLWVSNLMRRGDDDASILAAADDLAKLVGERPASLLLVSNEVGAGVHPPTAAGIRFADLLGQVNQRAAAAADRVTLMVAGLPLGVKGAPPAPDSHEPLAEAP